MPRDAVLVRSDSALPKSSSVVAAPVSGMLAEFYDLTEDGHRLMIMYFGMWTVGWIVLFYCCTATEPYWAGPFPKSTKRHENNRNWSARNLIGIIHATFISTLTLPACFLLYYASDDVRFGSTGHLALCSIGSERAELVEQWGIVCQAVALAGLAFTAFTVADTGISLAHGLTSVDYLAHHVAFIVAGVIIRGHCMLPFTGSILMAMEASTPFLNTLCFFRHRGPTYTRLVQVTGALFVVLFVLFRLVLNTYGAIVLWYHRHRFPPTVPQWQAWFLLLAVVAGAAVQFYWFPLVLRSFGHEALNLFRGSSTELSDPGAETLLRGTAAGDGGSASLSNTSTDYGSNEDEALLKEADEQKKLGPASSSKPPLAEAQSAPATPLPPEPAPPEPEAKSAAAASK